MWPHSITVGVGDLAIVIATDDPGVMSRLAPWRIDDEADPVDYCLENHPLPPEGSNWRRPLPGLWHGSTSLVRSPDRALVVETLMRVLASHERPAREGQLRLQLAAVAGSGGAVLMPLRLVTSLSDRRLRENGMDPYPSETALVDASTATLVVDPPLGSSDTPIELQLRGIWLESWDFGHELTPGQAVAEIMQLVPDVTVGNAAHRLHDVARLVQLVHPVVKPADDGSLFEELSSTLGEAGSGAP